MADLDFIAANPAMLAEHAASLADRLQERLAEVDRRESRLNSQEAEFDSRIRNARLWVEQCEADIAQRHAAARRAGASNWPNGRSRPPPSSSKPTSWPSGSRNSPSARRPRSSLQIELELGRTELQTKLDALDFETAACRTRQQELDEAKQKYEQRQRELDGAKPGSTPIKSASPQAQAALDRRTGRADSRGRAGSRRAKRASTSFSGG